MTDADNDRGLLAANIMHFGRALRVAGLPIGPGHVLRAIEAIGRSQQSGVINAPGCPARGLREFQAPVRRRDNQPSSKNTDVSMRREFLVSGLM